MTSEYKLLGEAIADGKYLLATDNPDPLKLVPVLEASQDTLPGFATLQDALIKDIKHLLQELLEYRYDETRKRPHNVLMVAAPGSGKSHFIKCLAKKLEIPFVAGNLSVQDVSSMLSFVVNEARNFKVRDELPLLFLDEVDSHPSQALPLLLPLLWDGELFVAGQVLKVGRCIIICAASNATIGSRQSQPPTLGSKVNDFLSRFNGSSLTPSPINSPARELDKLCIAAALIRRRFPKVDAVSIGLLQFLGKVPLQHEVRSLELIVSMIPKESIKDGSILLPPPGSAGSSTLIDVQHLEIDTVMEETFHRLLTDVRHSPVRTHIPDLDWAITLWREVLRA